MISSRWWLLAFSTAGVTAIAILVATGTPGPLVATGVAIVVVHFGVFLAVRTRPLEGEPLGTAFSAATALYAAALTAISPELALLQCVAFPIVWVLAPDVRPAIVRSAAVSVLVGVGFWVSLGSRVEVMPQILATQIASFGFSTVMGVWISRIAALGDEKARVLDELTAAQDELAALHRDRGVTEERARMAREVHDTVAQSLTGLVLLAQRARREIASGSLDDGTLELIETSARDALAETRALVAASAPVELTGGLAEALARLAERFERETRIRVTSTAELDATLERDAEVVLLRSAQEGLANVRKHSAASAARVELRVANGVARLRVSDDGRGFSADAPAGFGLAGLRERLALAGGELEVDGTPGATTLTATLPVGATAIAAPEGTT